MTKHEVSCVVLEGQLPWSPSPEIYPSSHQLVVLKGRECIKSKLALPKSLKAKRYLCLRDNIVYVPGDTCLKLRLVRPQSCTAPCEGTLSICNGVR